MKDVVQNPHIEAHFQKALAKLGLKNSARFIVESPYDPGRRIYEAKGRVFKFVLREYECTAGLRNQTLAGEYGILKILEGCQCVPQKCVYYEDDDFLVLSYKMLPGVPLNLKECNAWRFCVVLWGLMKVLYIVSKQGVCNNDIRADNVIVGGAGGPYLVDFDQASKASFTEALASNFIGRNKMVKTHNSFLGLIRGYVREHAPLPVKNVYKDIRNSTLGRYVQHRAGRLKPLPKNASEHLKCMYEAWELARLSNANAPGGFVCYYSLDFEGFHLPGERPWADRWAVFHRIIDVHDKRILELGCNLSLLSCHYLSEKDAAAALCVDRDADILAAAQKVAAAYSVSPSYRRVDFDAEEDWESELAFFKPDFVTALSVLNWVKDKERFLTFLGRFNEVLFEGHDSEEVERNRLVQHGFKNVRLVTISERNRPVLHGLK